ncbi:MAG: hypothetical protein KDD89_05625, partial [Anaerolineales bacterium]|nr:hypothetical protein [Anaerolineales bacterium]
LGFGHLPSFALGVVVGVAMGFLRTKLRLRRDQSPAALPASELPEHAREKAETAPTTSNPFRRAWQAWSQFAGEMGNVQGRMFMGYFYFIVVMPFALGAKLLSDPLEGKKQPATTGWHGREPASSDQPTLESTREQG